MIKQIGSIVFIPPASNDDQASRARHRSCHIERASQRTAMDPSVSRKTGCQYQGARSIHQDNSWNGAQWSFSSASILAGPPPARKSILTW